jgi:hypothetical protein
MKWQKVGDEVDWHEWGMGWKAIMPGVIGDEEHGGGSYMGTKLSGLGIEWMGIRGMLIEMEWTSSLLHRFQCLLLCLLACDTWTSLSEKIGAYCSCVLALHIKAQNECYYHPLLLDYVYLIPTGGSFYLRGPEELL